MEIRIKYKNKIKFKKKDKKIYIYSQPGFIILRELCSRLCNNLSEKRVSDRIDTCICITESLLSTPVPKMTLLFNYMPIKNFKNKEFP